MDDLLTDAEQSAIAEWLSASDDQLVARLRAAPDMGGAMIVELSEFMMARTERAPA